MLLSYTRLAQLAQAQVITNVREGAINSASIDLHLGDTVFLERPFKEGAKSALHTVRLAKRERLQMVEYSLERSGPLRLYPGQFVLAHTQETFNLPNTISGEYVLKSSMARIGLEHLNAGWCDAGWHGSVLTLELKNMTQHHVIELEYGVGIGQIVLFEHDPVPAEKSYSARGRYNGDTSVSQIKK